MTVANMTSMCVLLSAKTMSSLLKSRPVQATKPPLAGMNGSSKVVKLHPPTPRKSNSIASDVSRSVSIGIGLIIGH